MVSARQSYVFVRAFLISVFWLTGCADRQPSQIIIQETTKRYADDICIAYTMSGGNIFVAMKNGIMIGDIAHPRTHENFPLPAGSAVLHRDDTIIVGVNFVPPHSVEKLGKPIVDATQREDVIALATQAYANCKDAAVSSEKYIKDGSPFYIIQSSRYKF
jgi:hypothetical protein